MFGILHQSAVPPGILLCWMFSCWFAGVRWMMMNGGCGSDVFFTHVFHGQNVFYTHSCCAQKHIYFTCVFDAQYVIKNGVSSNFARRKKGLGENGVGRNLAAAQSTPFYNVLAPALGWTTSLWTSLSSPLLCFFSLIVWLIPTPLAHRTIKSMLRLWCSPGHQWTEEWLKIYMYKN